MKLPNKVQIQALREKYTEGTIIELISMNDVQAPPAGTKGTVHGVDDMGNILIKWQNGSSLNLLPDVDEFRVLEAMP